MNIWLLINDTDSKYVQARYELQYNSTAPPEQHQRQGQHKAHVIQKTVI